MRSARSWKATVEDAMHSGMMACTVLSCTGVRPTLSYSQIGKNLMVALHRRQLTSV